MEMIWTILSQHTRLINISVCVEDKTIGEKILYNDLVHIEHNTDQLLHHKD